MSMSSYPGGLYGDSADIRILHCGHIFGPNETQHGTTFFLLLDDILNGRAFLEDITTKM